MRFCGMCGTPLPYRPLTTPEAQSTLKYTSMPAEGAREGKVKSVSSSATMVLPERPTKGNGKPTSTAAISAASHDHPEMTAARSTLDVRMRPPEPPGTSVEARTRETHREEVESAAHSFESPVRDIQTATQTAEDVEVAAESNTPAREMVPDVPFDEYIRNFHYEPPSESTEVTMRCDSSVEEQQGSVAATPAMNEAIRDPHPPLAYATTEPPAFAETEHDLPAGREERVAENSPVPPPEAIAMTPASHDVEERLGLDAQAAPEVVERPRFLDVHEPQESRERATSGTSTIVGPSFLGLSDSPELGEAASYEEEEIAHKSHWRGWLAAAVVLIFAGLGYMEWRTQVNQTDNGPVEIMKAKIRSWTNGVAAPAEPAVGNSSTPANTKPEMQVQEQAKPQAQTHPDNSSTPTNSTSTSNAAATPAPTASEEAKPPGSSEAKAEPSSPSTSEATPAGTPVKATRPADSAGPASSSTAATTSGNQKPSRAAGASGDQQATGKPGPGADELKKAANASDSAAAAAWLWKSTAKGNPDAPVQLADMYMKGDGVPRSCEQAVVLLKTAAAKENARARNRLASMYASGNCVQRNRVEAYRWLSSALTANPHSDWAQQNKDLIWQQMTPDERVMAAKYR